jgi:hypothetical protein
MHSTHALADLSVPCEYPCDERCLPTGDATAAIAAVLIGAAWWNARMGSPAQ